MMDQDLKEVLKQAHDASPNGVLQRARNASSNLMALLPDTKVFNSVDKAASELINAFEALDEWLIRGGLLPDAWLVAFEAQAAAYMNADLQQ